MSITRKNPESAQGAEFHAISAITKPVSTWYAIECIHACRAACGGLGYAGFALFEKMRTDIDVNISWEGDNDVLF